MAFIDPVGANTADSSAINMPTDTRPANPFVKTGLTFTEVVASTSADWSGFYVTMAQGRPGIVSVWTGTASSEVLIASMPATATPTARDGFLIYVPVPVASGTRLSISMASRATGQINELQISGIPSSNFDAEPNFTIMDCGPFLLSGGSGDYADTVPVDPGGTANTLGSYTQLSLTGGNDNNNVLNGDSLDFQYKYLGFLFGENEQGAQTLQNRLWDIARGAGGSEVNEISELYDKIDDTETNVLSSVIWIPWDRASGDRITARMQCSITDAVDRIGQALIFGLR